MLSPRVRAEAVMALANLVAFPFVLFLAAITFGIVDGMTGSLKVPYTLYLTIITLTIALAVAVLYMMGRLALGEMLQGAAQARWLVRMAPVVLLAAWSCAQVLWLLAVDRVPGLPGWTVIPAVAAVSALAGEMAMHAYMRRGRDGSELFARALLGSVGIVAALVVGAWVVAGL